MIRKALLTATVQSHIAQFHIPLIDMLKENGYEVHVAARDNLAEKNGLKLDSPDKVHDIPFARSPLSTANILAYMQLKKIIDENYYDIIHCNTPVGGVVTRLAARKARHRGTQVFYTAHGFHFYQGGPWKNWIIYYPIEKHLARLTDKLITINQEDYLIAKKHFRTNVSYIHGVGVNEEKYKPMSESEISSLREALGYDKEEVLILCTGELNDNKNQQTIIKALSEIRKKTSSNIKLLIAGSGPNEQILQRLVNQLGIDGAVIFLGYRTDLEKYVNICDVVTSASYREGLPFNIMEAMLCGKPIVASINRGHKELVSEGATGYLVNANDMDGFVQRIIQLCNDKQLRYFMGGNGKKAVQSFTSESVKRELMKIYSIY